MDMPSLRIANALAVVLLSAAAARGVKPESWTHEQPKDFNSAQLKDVAVTSQGEVVLSRKTTVLHDAEKQAGAINALAVANDGRIFAASGPSGHIYLVQGDKVTTLATLSEGNVFSLLTFEGTLLAGTGGGEQARIYTIDSAGKATVFYEPTGAKYVWAMARGPSGEIYVATGDEGKLFVCDAQGKNGKVLADLKVKNILCLVLAPDNMLYAGTDEDGLIYRINPASGKPYVMYDAAEDEISAILADSRGNIFAATAAAAQAHPGRSAGEKTGGKPDQPTTSESKPATQPSGPKATTKPMDASSLLNTLRRAAGGKPATASATGAGAGASGSGNAIYQIDTFGFVTEVFREPVMILDILEHQGTLYACTGNEGRVYKIVPGEDRTTMLAKLEPTQAVCLARPADGGLVIGTANAARIVRMSEDYAPKGTLTAKPLDAEQIVRWGRVRFESVLPPGTRMTISTRSSNVADEESEAWEAWSPEMDAASAQQVPSPGARFLQYRVTLETNVSTATPLLRSVTIARVQDNRPPVIEGLEVLSAVDESQKPTGNPKVKQLIAQMSAAANAGGGDDDGPPALPKHHYVVKWKAQDPNADTLQYEAFYRQAGAGRWIRLAKELKETLHVWDARTVPDGRYEFRVTATDKLGNSPGDELTDARVSDPVTIDNTPPDVNIERVEPVGKDGLKVTVSLNDLLSPLASAAYLVDSAENWTVLSPADGIFDAPRESLSFTIDDLDNGEHWIALRVSDGNGNTRHVSRLATVGQ